MLVSSISSFLFLIGPTSMPYHTRVVNGASIHYFSYVFSVLFDYGESQYYPYHYFAHAVLWDYLPLGQLGVMVPPSFLVHTCTHHGDELE